MTTIATPYLLLQVRIVLTDTDRFDHTDAGGTRRSVESIIFQARDNGSMDVREVRAAIYRQDGTVGKLTRTIYYPDEAHIPAALRAQAVAAARTELLTHPLVVDA